MRMTQSDLDILDSLLDIQKRGLDQRPSEEIRARFAELCDQALMVYFGEQDRAAALHAVLKDAEMLLSLCEEPLQS